MHSERMCLGSALTGFVILVVTTLTCLFDLERGRLSGGLFVWRIVISGNGKSKVFRRRICNCGSASRIRPELGVETGSELIAVGLRDHSSAMRQRRSDRGCVTRGHLTFSRKSEVQLHPSRLEFKPRNVQGSQLTTGQAIRALLKNNGELMKRACSGSLNSENMKRPSQHLLSYRNPPSM